MTGALSLRHHFFQLSGSLWDCMEITTSDSQTKHFDIALLKEKRSKWWRSQRGTVYFSVGMRLRALTWWFLPTPINYLEVPSPLRHIISVLYRYNNVAQCIAMPRPHSHDLRAPCAKRIEWWFLSHRYYEFNAHWVDESIICQKLLIH